MSKREYGLSAGASDAEGSRTKRRKETAGGSSDVDVTMSDPVVQGGEASSEGGGMKQEVVKEQGLKLWQTVKDAVNKEGRTLSLDFLRRPSKRQYPDYYQLIQRPIALDEIKKQIENGAYASLEAIKLDFELCFNNAKQYNMKDSDIWKDAKDLLKLVNRTYSKMAPPDDDGENADGDGERKGKLKGPNLNRLVKSRLQKLVDKSDSSGRVLSTEFMELPSKKDWPIYYKEIKRPQCLENIFKRIKRKEYYSSGEFAADVELVFANAMTFNQEHTGIWEDAKALRDYFRLLMSDLPPPYGLPEYTKPSNGKIKIRMPHAPQPSGSSSTPAHQPTADQSSSSSSLLLRVPVGNPTNHSKPPPQPAAADSSNATLPVAASSTLPATSPSIPSATPTTQPPTAPTQALSYLNATFSHYPNASYLPSGSTAPAASSSAPTNSLVGTHSVSNSPAPQPIHPSHQLKVVSLKIQPRGHTVNLDYRDGVKSWAMRLGPGETSIHVGPVMFLSDEEEESSGEEEEAEPEEKQEEEEEEDEHISDVPVKNGRKKGKNKGKGRSKGTAKATIAKAKVATAKKKKQKVGLVQLKLNGLAVKDQEDQEGDWIVHLPVGSNILEIGEAGGLVWKVYVERLGGA